VLAAVEVRDARWSGISVSRVQVRETMMDACDLSDASLSDAEISDTLLHEPNLSNAVLVGGSLTRVRLTGGRLTGTQLAETKVEDTVFASVSAGLSAMRNAELVRVTFDSCNLREADFGGCRCDCVRFHHCDLTAAIFSKARLSRCEFRGCKLDAIEGIANLSGASIDFQAVLGLAAEMAEALGIKLLDA
jgi:uncharacterized protein YjbI with pentapeptide repeats